MVFWTQYKALLHKNWILWKRKIVWSLLELLLPLLTMSVIGMLRIAVPPSAYDSQTFEDQVKDSYVLDSNLIIGDAPFSKCMNKGETLLGYSIISSDEKFIDYMQDGIKRLSQGKMTENLYIPFNTISEFEDYIKSSDYEDSIKLCFGVSLKETSTLNYEMNLRFNITETIYDTGEKIGEFVDIFNLKSNSAYNDLIVSPSPYLEDFYDYGFLSLMNLAHNYFLQKNDPGAYLEAKIYPMRFDSYKEDKFLPILRINLVFFLIFSFIIPICRLIAAIVDEKESRTKEMMMMMGLNSAAYWLSWITYYFAIFTVVSVLVTIILYATGVFVYSNGGLVFLVFWLFSLSCISFSLFLSIFFSKTRTAVSVTIPLFIGSYFVSIPLGDPLISMTRKVTGSLLPCVAFKLGIDVVSILEVGQKGMQVDNPDFEVDNFSHGLFFTMILVDILYMSVLAFYLESVWPTEWGVKRPWNFLFTKNYWCPKKVKVENDDNINVLNTEVVWGDAVEQVDEALEAQKTSGKAMIVRGLKKEFNNKLAVDGLNLDMYEGQIFALLGHNGAGKTTTISMLTGLIPATSGEMAINGNLLSKDLGLIRKKLGVCPQQNILFPDLTPMEHMDLFCKFKGMSNSAEIKKISEQKLSELELTSKKDSLVKNLSGGQKRKLQLALALVGDSPVVLLDEPTSGMDLTARRHVWDTLKNNKAGKIIILTTHYMEEADVLADRIAIMSQGKLRCCGSSFFLKSRYGVGYYLTMIRNQEAIKNTKKIESFVCKYVDGAKLMSDSHGEITFQMPSSSSEQFPKFFENLESSFQKLGLLSYSISATTLEEVFLRVARGDEELNNSSFEVDKEKSSLFWGAEFSLEKDKQQGSLFIKHSIALFKKRVLTTMRDKRTLAFEIFIPLILIIIGLALMLVPAFLETYSAYELKFSRYKSIQNVFYSGETEGLQYLTKITETKTQYVDVSTLESFSDVLLDNLDLQPKIVSSYYFDQINIEKNAYNITVFTDQKAYQSYPTVYNTISNQILKKALGDDFNIKVFNHPMPITKEMKSLVGGGYGFIGGLVFSMGFSFIPTSIVLFITKERENNVKHQHMISGVSLIAYWFSNFVWDLIKSTFTAVLASLFVMAFNVSIYTDEYDDLQAMWALMILGVLGQVPFAYMFSFFFKNHSTAQVVMLNLSFITGSALPSVVYALYLFEASRSLGKVLAWVLKIFPNFCFGWGVLNVGSKNTFQVILSRDEPYKAFDIQSAGGCILVLGLITIVYFIFVIILELFETNPSFVKRISKNIKVNEETYEPDDDVEREAQIAINTSPSEVKVNVKNLCKSFDIKKKTFTAVNDLSFNVNPEECFALLGVNGAGKTTTFKMLTGEIFSDHGSAHVSGYNISSELSKARTHIGYCPQFDSITELLTAEEHLELYAHIKGIPNDKIKEQVDYMLSSMDLEQYRKVPAGTYSGGNKRKLSVAMALIGNPSVVFLDEPSAGMDPEARKKMWKILGSIKKQKSAVILTTHSMEEAEALCDRMTIMARGRFKCIGSSTWIKNKFGDGYEIEIKVQQPSKQEINEIVNKFENLTGKGISFEVISKALENIGFEYLEPSIGIAGYGAGIYNTITNEGYISKEAFGAWCLIEHLGKNVENWLRNMFQLVEVIEHYNLMFKFRIKRDHVKSIGELFSAVEAKKIEMKISDYAISMPSLEQIFNRFAKKAEQEESGQFRNDPI